MSTSEDDIIDALPLHLRNKVLSSIEIDEGGNVKRAEYKAPQRQKQILPEGEQVKSSGGKMFLWFVLWVMTWPLAFVATAVGLALCLTVIGAPFGVGIMMVGCGPSAIVFGKMLTKKNSR